MGNFAYSSTSSVTTSDGAKLENILTNVSANAKVLFDQIVGPGPVSINVGTFASALGSPQRLLIVADGNGFKFNVDGLGMTVKAYTEVSFGFAPTPTGPINLVIEAQGGAQRIRMIGVGL